MKKTITWILILIVSAGIVMGGAGCKAKPVQAPSVEASATPNTTAPAQTAPVEATTQASVETTAGHWEAENDWNEEPEIEPGEVLQEEYVVEETDGSAQEDVQPGENQYPENPSEEDKTT